MIGMPSGVEARSIMRFSEYRFLVRADLHRYRGAHGWRAFLRHVLMVPGFKYTFWMRTCAFLGRRGWARLGIYLAARVLLNHYQFKYGFDIPHNTRIGPGFYLGHFGGVTIQDEAVIGRNCNLSQGVTLGQANRGKRQGCPVVGDGVYFGPGSKVVGKVSIGNDVAVGANCVVTRDIPDHAVVVGIPGEVISLEGAAGYVDYTDYGQS